MTFELKVQIECDGHYCGQDCPNWRSPGERAWCALFHGEDDQYLDQLPDGRFRRCLECIGAEERISK